MVYKMGPLLHIDGDFQSITPFCVGCIQHRNTVYGNVYMNCMLHRNLFTLSSCRYTPHAYHCELIDMNLLFNSS